MTDWEKFADEKLHKIMSEKKSVIDIGGGLRISKKAGNRYDPSRAWLAELIARNSVDYKILDPVADYSPDIVGDIHQLPFADNSQEAIVCAAVLEHVEDPFTAVRELHRVLKPGGYCFVYVPFLYYFHAEKGYYHDYWRFTGEGVDLLFKRFSSIEKQSVRGAVATWVHLSPLGRCRLIVRLAYLADRLFGKDRSRQVSGYNIFLIK